jgi:hypothetical protein
MARIYAMGAITEWIYCDLKNTNLQIYCSKKIHVIKKLLPPIGFLVVIFPTKK